MTTHDRDPSRVSAEFGAAAYELGNVYLDDGNFIRAEYWLQVAVEHGARGAKESMEELQEAAAMLGRNAADKGPAPAQRVEENANGRRVHAVGAKAAPVGVRGGAASVARAPGRLSMRALLLSLLAGLVLSTSPWSDGWLRVISGVVAASALVSEIGRLVTRRVAGATAAPD